MRRGYLTTEFWALVAFGIADLVTALATDQLTGQVAIVAFAAAAGLYALARGWAKSGGTETFKNENSG